MYTYKEKDLKRSIVNYSIKGLSALLLLGATSCGPANIVKKDPCLPLEVAYKNSEVEIFEYDFGLYVRKGNAKKTPEELQELSDLTYKTAVKKIDYDFCVKKNTSNISWEILEAERANELQRVQQNRGRTGAYGYKVATATTKGKALPPLDSTPPAILITSPNVSRGVKLTAKDASITVIGTATDESGVATVTVNGEMASIDANGNFSADVLLKVGENRIIVAATDIRKNTATESFLFVRESGKVAKAKPEATKSAMDIRRGQYYALLIGNNSYRQLTSLQTAVNDATTIEKVLKDSYGFQTRLILNATRKDILSAINDLRNKLSERDNLLIYYAGHGNFDRSAEKAYWLPVDALRDNPIDWIIADDITSSIKRLSAQHVLIVSDSCYSGTLSRNAQTNLISKGDRDEFLTKMMNRPSRTLMASGGNEPVTDGGGSGHSIFAYSFIKALKEIDLSVFTADELFYQSIRSRVAGRSEQIPEYSEIRNSGHDGGDFVFIRNKK